MNFIIKHLAEKFYKKVREQEKNLPSDNFTACYLLSEIMCYFLISLFFVIFLFFAWKFLDKFFIYISGGISIGCFLFALYLLSYRCVVDDNGITVKKFWFFEK